MNKVQIIGEGGAIRIAVLGYERASAENDSDANWLVCHVAIDVPPFQGEFDASFSTQDFAHFGDGLVLMLEKLEGEATFSPDEGALLVRLKMLSRGQLTVEGDAATVGAGRVALSFTFSSDQSYLSDLQRSIKELLTSFPVRAVT